MQDKDRKKQCCRRTGSVAPFEENAVILDSQHTGTLVSTDDHEFKLSDTSSQLPNGLEPCFIILRFPELSAQLGYRDISARLCKAEYALSFSRFILKEISSELCSVCLHFYL